MHDAPATTPIAAGAECPACGYSLGGLTMPRCPECGRDIREIEVRLGQSRKMFLELTCVRVIVLPIALVLASWWMQGGLILPILGAVCIAIGALVGERLARTVRGPEQQLVRRMWWLALPFAQGTWLTAAICLAVYYSLIAPQYGNFYSPWARVWGDITAAESTAVFIIAAAAGLVGWLAWFWRWNRMCALLGLPESVRAGPALRRAMWITHVLPLAVVGLRLCFWILARLLDLLLDAFPQLYS